MTEEHDYRIGTFQTSTTMMDVARMLASKESARFATRVTDDVTEVFTHPACLQDNDQVGSHCDRKQVKDCK